MSNTAGGINTETGEVVTGRSPRFTQWVAFLVFATITMGSSVEVKNQLGVANSAARWAVGCSAVTFTFTILMVVAHMLPFASVMVVGTRLEGFLIFVLACFWAAEVAIVTNADNDLGVSSDTTNQVLNGNLYYFSWAGFVTSIVLLVNYMKSAFGVDMVGQFHNRAQRLSLWAGLLASSLVVMGSSVRVLNGDCSSADATGDAEYCRRTKYAISTGAIGVIFAVVIVAMKMLTTAAPLAVELVLSVFLMILDAFGVAYITSPSGPGSPIGNLYYFSWASFLLSALLTADCFNQRAGPTTNANSMNGQDDLNLHKQNDQDHTDIDVENMDGL